MNKNPELANLVKDLKEEVSKLRERVAVLENQLRTNPPAQQYTPSPMMPSPWLPYEITYEITCAEIQK